MKGYPAGTKCVITFSTFPANAAVRLGQVVTVGPYVAPPGRTFFHGPTKRILRNKQWKQELIDVPSYREGARFIYPVEWMRPLEDPDEQTIEQEDEVTS